MRGIRPEDANRFTEREAELWRNNQCSMDSCAVGVRITHCGRPVVEPDDEEIRLETLFCAECCGEW